MATHRISRVVVNQVVIELLERQPNYGKGVLASDYIITAQHQEEPTIHTIAYLGHSEGYAYRSFDRAIEIAKEELVA